MCTLAVWTVAFINFDAGEKKVHLNANATYINETICEKKTKIRAEISRIL